MFGIVLISIYTLSLLRNRWFVRALHSENGLDYGKPVSKIEFIFTFVPVLNTFVAIVFTFLGESPYTETYRHEMAKKQNYNKFFGIKNK